MSLRGFSFFEATVPHTHPGLVCHFQYPYHVTSSSPKLGVAPRSVATLGTFVFLHALCLTLKSSIGIPPGVLALLFVSELSDMALDNSGQDALPSGVFSILDTDLYKLTMQSAILKYLPDVRE